MSILPPHPTLYLDISPPHQVLTGTTPFTDESDEEIVDKVAAGLRPDRPPDDPSRELADELWEQIVACWDSKPNERPTASKVLRALGEVKQREDAGDSDDETVVREENSVTEDHEQSTFSAQL